jgi:hypothetical protein
MKRPKLEDAKTPSGHQSIGGRSVNVYTYSKMQDEYIDYLESKAENLPISDVVGRSEQFICYKKDFEDKPKCSSQCQKCGEHECRSK